MIEVLVERCILLKYIISSVILNSFTRPMYPIVTTTLRLEQLYLFFEKVSEFIDSSRVRMCQMIN